MTEPVRGMTESVSPSCPACSAAIEVGAEFCGNCGRPVNSPPEARLAPARVGDAMVRRDRTSRVRSASKWLAALGVMFVVFGTAFGFMNKSESDKARAILAEMDPNQVVEVEGKSYTVAELDKRVAVELYLGFGLNYFLAAVMFGLHFWSRRAPFPAMVTGLCVYLAVIVLNGVLEPKTLVQGILIKVLFIGAMIAGIRAALEERDEASAAGAPGRAPGRAP